jgi:oligopeptide transport system substrate-binding protein
MPTIQYGDDWIKPDKLVNDGPFRLKGVAIELPDRLEKNPTYWDAEHVALNTIDALPIDNSITAYNFYASKWPTLFWTRADTAIAHSELKTRQISFGLLGTYFIRFNVARKPFDDVGFVRRSPAIDRDRIVENHPGR